MKSTEKFKEIAACIGEGAPINSLMTLLVDIEQNFMFGNASNQIKIINHLLNYWVEHGGLKEAFEQQNKNEVPNLIFNVTKLTGFLAAVAEIWPQFLEHNPDIVAVMDVRPFHNS